MNAEPTDDGRERREDVDEDEFFGFRPLHRRGSIITNELIDGIREEIGD